MINTPHQTDKTTATKEQNKNEQETVSADHTALDHQKIAELTELLQRTQANFENFRKQTEKRVQEMQLIAAKGVITQLLPIIDNFELALKSIENKDQGLLQEFVAGIELIYGQCNSLLDKNQVKRIETQGKSFDPYVHEALLKVESDLPENTIIEELKRGFTMHGQVVRHAQVKISSGKKESKKETKTKETKQDLKNTPTKE
ncbi:MAG: nucleotide exchange factor GrpE [Nanoarchaeota archaeon]|nr:nucleotide exchange factor GrpE [Nanoarchaeota archaeon]